MHLRRPWHEIDVQQVLDELASSQLGLSADEAKARLATFGPNVLPRTKRAGPLKLFARQLKNPLPLLLIGSGLLAIILGKPTDGVVVLAVVVLNALIGAFQEHRAVRAIEALDLLMPERVKVRRDGLIRLRDSAELVPGDVVLLEAGDRVPADLRVLTARNCRVNEASLTGESVPVHKSPSPVPGDVPLAERSSMLFSGTFVASGTAEGVVVATGAQTELGRLSIIVRESRAPITPLTLALKKLGARITEVVLVASVAVFAVAYRRGFVLLDAIRSGVALAAATAPVGLPAVITIALALAVQRMAARNAPVRNLPTVETLGSTTVICSDKTGTLTAGEMTVRRIWAASSLYELTGAGYSTAGELWQMGRRLASAPDDVLTVLRAASLCSDAVARRTDGLFRVVGDPTEIALVVAAEKLGIDVSAAREQWPRLDVLPFDASTRYMATLHRLPDGAKRIIVKGAPEVVVERCEQLWPGQVLDKAAVLELVAALAAVGMRMLAVAWRKADPSSEQLSAESVSSLVLLGVVGSIDPPRPEAIVAIAACKSAGIRVKMVTGDHPTTARAVAAELMLTEPGRAGVLTGSELDAIDPAEFEQIAADVDVFARVEPEHKLRLVRALQARGEVVAMTGDGVNDAPALKQADVGVAMGVTGTAVAREAADIVLADDNFATIVAAVEEGRRTYDNLIKSLVFLLPTNLGQGLVVLVGVFFFPVVDGISVMPLVPLQILWVNFVTGVTLALPLAFEAAEPDVMRRPPRRRDAPIVDRHLVARCALVGLLMTCGTVGLFLYQYYGELVIVPPPPVGPPDIVLRKAQTMAATTLVLFQVLYLMQCRSLRTNVFAMNPFANPTVYIGIGATLLMHLAFVYAPPFNLVFHSAPLDPDDWALSALVASSVLPAVAVHKHLTRRAWG